MSGFFGHPALALLLQLKLRGSLRRTWRRMRSPRGAALTLFGAVLLSLWGFSVFMTPEQAPQQRARTPEELRLMIRLVAAAFTVISLGTAFVHRGLFLPKPEIERLFSAPLSRSDLVRHRLLVGVGKGLVGGLIFAFVMARRLPSPIYGYFGALVSLQMLPLWNQLAAILAGALEGRLARHLRWIGRVGAFLAGITIAALVGLLAMGGSAEDLPLFGKSFARLVQLGPDGSIQLPVLMQRALLFYEPWARLLSARNAFDFFTWLGVCVGLWVLTFELTARLRVDFRELSLETAANVAARLRRVQRGGGAAAGKALRASAWTRVPWFFGAGPTRAVAWRKGTTMVRKARGTLLISVFVVVLVTLLSSLLVRGEAPFPEQDSTPVWLDAAAPSLVIALVGTLYLCSGLRFDFREDLDRMESMRAWPIRPSRLFLGTVLPQTLLVTGILWVAIGLRAAATNTLHPAVLVVLAFLPPVVLAWIALDNAVFLFLPVRLVPGQEGVLPNAGRAFLVLILRVVILALVAGVGGGVGMGVYVLVERWGGASASVAASATLTAAWGTLVGLDAVLLLVGGVLVARFDVARHVR